MLLLFFNVLLQSYLHQRSLFGQTHRINEQNAATAELVLTNK